MTSASCAAGADLEAPPHELPETAEGRALGHGQSALSSLARAGVADGAGGQVAWRWLNLTADVPTQIETRDCTDGADPVLHLLRSNLTGIAVDDNSGGGVNARLSVQVATSGTYPVLIRSAGDGPRGTCQLLQDGVAQGQPVEVAGFTVELSNLRAREVLETVRLPGHAAALHALYMLDAAGVGIELSASGGGTGTAVSRELTQPLGTRSFIVSVPGARARLVRNDVRANLDRDQDGLGDELEQALGTCSDLVSDVAGFGCGFATDPRDSDGDGLTDGWEVLGRRDTTPHQTLPAWGSDPRHKDIFAEVDFMQRQGPSEPDVRMTPAVARLMAAYYAGTDRARTPQSLALIARALRNPDGRPGIALHLDTGVDATEPSDLTIFGNWGGHSVVAPVLENGQWRGRSSGDSFRSAMNPVRHGLFRYLLGYPSGGASCAEHAMHCAIPLDSAAVAAHEMGHTLGSGHSGPSYGDTADPNCKPNYRSLMNYSYLGATGFHDGTGGSLHPLALRERGAGYAAELLEQLATRFQYTVDRTLGYVDWNRDGVFSAGLVQEYANYTPSGGGCEWTRAATTLVGARSEVGPALVGVGARVGMFYGATGDGRLAFSASANATACTGPEVGCNGASFATRTGLTSDAIAGVDALTLPGASESEVLVATVNSAGKLEARTFTVGSTGSAIALRSGPWLLENERVLPAVSLSATPDGSAMLAYRSDDRKVLLRRFDGAVWHGSQAALRDDGTQIIAAEEGAPALGWVRVPRASASSLADYVEGLYLAVAEGEAHVLKLYVRDEMTLRFVPVLPWEHTAPSDVRGKPALAWVSGLAGRTPRLYLHFTTGADRMMWRMISHARGVGTAARHSIGLFGYFDNAWYAANGHDMLFRPGRDASLRVATAFRSGDPARNGELQFRPFGDGMVSHELVGWNDFETFGVDLCRTTVAASSAPAVLCQPWRWAPGTYSGLIHASAEPEFCVHKKTPDWNNGNALHIWSCQSGPLGNKSFRWERRTGYIRAVENLNMCWHKSRADWLPGQTVHLWDCASGGEEQKSWVFDAEREQIRSRARPDMCIAKEAGVFGNGKTLRLELCDSVPEAFTRWSL
jgi:hypothetical protein